MVEFDISRVNDEIYSPEKTRAIRKSYLDAVKSLEETRATIDAPQKKEETLIRDIEYYEAALAPHKRLPDDVLREIFIHCADSYGRVTIPLGLNEDRPPQLVLSHVCSSWRTLALSTHHLWSNVKVQRPSDLEKPFGASITWLQKAGTAPASLELAISGSDSSKLATLFEGPLRLGRVTLLDLSIESDGIPKFFALDDDALPHVQEIRLDTAIEDKFPSRVPSFIRHTRYLRFSREKPDSYALHRVAFPWGQMRHLNCYAPMTATDCLDLLGQTVLLEECRLCVVNEHGDNLELCKEVKLPKLHVLVVDGGDAENALTRIIKSISAPAMKRLVIEGTLNLGKEMIPVLKTRFNLNLLEEIDFCDLSGTEVPIDALLREATSLRHVVLTEGRNLDENILTGLEKGDLGPCLHTIEIPRECDAQEILNMVEARQGISESSDSYGSQKITPFRHVGFWSEEKYEKFAKKIAAFKTVGVEIVMNGYPEAPDRVPETWSELTHVTWI
ncbi:hypothetical protein AX17_003241 [Amanita inopinata Kibby_2008]|nr:hypothetical protein AX17_003241 [Amanita inopinata Kibby_2008]